MVGVAGVREEMEQMALMLVYMDQAEQVDQAFHSRFLSTMEEMLKCMVRVEMAEQTESLVSSLEQAVRQIQEMVVVEELPLPSSHQMLGVLSLWVEKGGLDWS
jgi:hypothetical protein